MDRRTTTRTFVKAQIWNAIDAQMPKYTVPKRMTVAAWGAPSDVSIQHQGPAGP